MDFFEHQEIAKRKSSVLFVYFAIAVVLIVVAVYLAVAGVFLAAQAKLGGPGHTISSNAFWNPRLFAGVAGATVLVIALGSLYKIGSLRGGGETVARELGGRPINPSTRDLDERVVLNVVEEMAIASGSPVPPVFLLDDEAGINAFAAGFSANDAVIGVTRGTIETLTREELQGVIAHEFSHILNGDMRLNIRLIGVLHGILLIALIGYGILRSFRHVRLSSRGSKKDGGAALIIAMLAIGVAFLIIGYVGVFFGKLIKSAVSRQREFLADASAVQFTRDPSGIAGALRKIGGHTAGSRVKDEMAVEASHLFFGNALGASFLNLLSTHPPLDERIKRIDPSFDGKYSDVKRVQHTARDLQRMSLKPMHEAGTAAVTPPVPGAKQPESRIAAFAFQPESSIASIGTLDPEHVDYAARLVASIPNRLVQTVHEPLGAVATVCCLLLDKEPAVRRLQLQSLAENSDPATNEEVRRTMSFVDSLGAKSRLPLVEMAIPALCQLSENQYRSFCEIVRRLVEADLKINLFEFALQRILLRQLSSHLVKHKPPTVKYSALKPLLPSCSCLLSSLAHAGHRDAAAAQQAFGKGVTKLAKESGELAMSRPEQCGFKALANAIDHLAEASPAIKKRVLQASAACIEADGQITVQEAELLRIIAISLDCPMPPLLD